VRLWRALLASFSYFSILPSKAFGERADGDAIALLPIVGLVIGGLAGWGAYGAYALTHSAAAAAIVAWVLSIALSGAIHIDGFLDCCDGLFAMASPERRLEIMRDPHHGTYAVAGMAMLSAVWLYALLQIAPGALPVTLAMAAGFGRLSGAGVAAPRNPLTLVSIVAIVLTFAWYFRGHEMGFAVAAVLASLAGFVVQAFARHRLGGKLNGDCYGAIVAVTELVLLLTIPYAAPLP
jgi:adenosylcobinamide-GDP ribazoletransferase